MKRSVQLLFLICATRAAFALTCGGFSIVPADHIIVKYSTPLPAGATLTPPAASVLGTNVTVSRNVSGGSAVDVTCVDDRVDLGYLGGGRFNLTWVDNASLSSQRSSFTFFVGAPATGYSGDFVDVLPPALPDRPVRLAVSTCTRNQAVAYVSGNDIFLSLADGTETSCGLSILDLGILPPGIYNVRHPRLTAPGPFQFIVQQPAPTSACIGKSFVTRTEAGTARLHYEDHYRGYTPTFGPPTAMEIDGSSNLMTVIQPVADTANSEASGASPPLTICHAEEIDLGPPAGGYNQVSWWDQVNAHGFESYQSANFFWFYWLPSVGAQCTSDGQLLTPSALEGAEIDVALNLLYVSFPVNGIATVDGHTITVYVNPYYFGPSDPTPTCVNFGAKIHPLPAGNYTLVWHVGWLVATTHLTVVKPTRGRAARH